MLVPRSVPSLFRSPPPGRNWVEQARPFRNYPGVTRSISPTAADLPPDAPVEERIIALRQDGLSTAGIAKRLQLPHAEVHAVISDWAAGYFGPNRRNDMLAIVTARLERLFEAHREKAYRGDIQATNACLKVCAHLASMHGLYQPSIAFANSTSNVMIDARPITSTDRLEKALAALIEDGKKTAVAKAAPAAAHDSVAAVPAETSE